MSEQTYATQLGRIIESLGVAEVIRATAGENHVTVLFRVTSKFPDGKLDERPLLVALERLVLHDPTGKGSWISHVCSRLLPKMGEDGKWRMVKGWNITINSSDLDNDLHAVGRLLRGEPDTRKGPKELTEVPLVGSGPSRNPPKKEGKGKGKGAWTVAGGNDFKPNG